jgi:protein farnesyltransferase/geranylgeranyltransferase type-1 subunit alpha
MSASAASPPSPATRAALLARPLQQNRHWADVQPLKQDDGEAQGQMPVVPINYPPHYSDVMDMFRAVLSSHELSQRTLLLTEAVIECNSANYSAWHFRRLCLEHLQSSISDELEWVATIARDTPKNYQLWHHRRCLLERLDDRSPPRALSELELTAEVLEMDNKNYHAWSHRQWCLVSDIWQPSASVGLRMYLLL